MTTNAFRYGFNVFNDKGYVLELPSVADKEGLRTAIDPNPYAQSSEKLFPLGTKLINGERIWRYTLNSSAGITIVGNILQSSQTVHSDAEEDIVVATSTGEAYAIGSFDISLVSTSNIAAAPWSTKDGGKDGYVYVNGGTGVGQYRKIKSHEAFSSTNDTLVTVYDAWTVAPIAADTECGIVQNPYANVVVAKAGLTGPPVGVATIAITASYYFWAQTGGPCAITANTAIAQGVPVVVGTTAGKADPFSAFTTEYIIGFCITAGIKSNDAFLAFLIMDR